MISERTLTTILTGPYVKKHIKVNNVLVNERVCEETPVHVERTSFVELVKIVLEKILLIV